MKKLRPKDILFNDPYFEQAMYCGPAEFRKTKRVDILGKWYKVPVLAATLLKEGALTFTHDIGTQKAQRRLIFRMYEQTPVRLFINTYFWTTQLHKEVYVGTIHIERYDTVQQLHHFQYKGIIDLVSIEQDDNIVEIAPEFKLIQEVKHEFAISLGMYLLAVSDIPWADTVSTDSQAVQNPVLPLSEQEREELQQLRTEQKEMQACQEELLRLRIEANNRKAVQAELQRLRHELNTERSERARDKEAYEKALKEKEHYIEKIKEKAAQQLNAMLAMRDELKKLKTIASSNASPATQTTSQAAIQTPPNSADTADLSIPTFMSQHDYTRDLDMVLSCQRVSYIGGSMEWQQYVAARFPQLLMLLQQKDPMRAIEASKFVIIHLYEGETEEIKQVVSMAKEAHCAMITTTAYNLNNMARDVLRAVQQL